MKQDEIRILFVEDDDMIRDLYCDILQSRNWSCKAAKNGNEALKIIPSFQPHIMITDLLMPEKNGFDLIDEVKALSPDVKIIIASGSATVHSQTLNTCGVNDILNKPFSAKELFSTIEKQFKSDNQPQK